METRSKTNLFEWNKLQRNSSSKRSQRTAMFIDLTYIINHASDCFSQYYMLAVIATRGATLATVIWLVSLRQRVAKFLCSNTLEISPTDMIQSTTAEAPVLSILHTLLLSKYQSDWYDTMPSTSHIDTTTQPSSVAVLFLLIWYSLPLQSISPTDTTTNLCPSASPTDLIQSTSFSIPELLIR